MELPEPLDAHLPPNCSLEDPPASPCATRAPALAQHSQVASLVIIVVVGVIILGTVVGNVLVVVAVFTSRALRAPQNLFLVSLAAADILVATLVIPFSLANEIMGYWYFGSTWCSFYLALDVLFCTSSIVHLCAISLDRYWSVTKAVSYNRRRTPRRIKAMIGVVWLISVVVSSPPLLMSQSESGPDRHECLINNQTWYILSSCVVSFFAPGVIMILVYCKIYRVAKQRAATVFMDKSAAERPAIPSCFEGERPSGDAQVCPEETTLPGGRAGAELDHIDLEERSCPPRTPASFPSSLLPRRSNTGTGAEVEGARLRPPPPSCASWTSSDLSCQHFLLPSPACERRAALSSAQSRVKLAAVRERRFTLVLAVVMGAFVVCWFPFFFTYSLHAVCRERCPVPPPLFNLFFWIGYCNSSLNPVIYTVFNRDFRRAFRRILCPSHQPQ